ncbi:MAG: hypothetical protein L6R36_001144 [Xanthoria steineri]|nr:MAG: hypothetical protein L6R36_001144 [Xanthoria steineri]
MSHHAQISQIFRKMLLSYRRLFGQTKASRRIFNRSEKIRATGEDKVLNPLLVQLCGSKGAIEEMLPDGSVHARTMYTRQQFSHLYAKLLRLLAYIVVYKMSKVRDRWKDWSICAEWLAFWTLLVAGVLSVMSSFVQIALSAAQLQQATKSPPEELVKGG